MGKRLLESLGILEKTARGYPDSSWEVGFSGGKDSTVVCHIVFEYVSQAIADGSPLPSKIFIVHSDTLLDLPVLRRHSLATMRSMADYARRFDGLVETTILKPADGEDFFSMIVDRGYSSPHFRFRWCMGRLKLDPTIDFLCQLRNVAMVTGVRNDESNSRHRNMEARGQRTPITESGGTLMIAPILTWGIKDVWAFLSTFRQPWNGESYQELFELYRMGDGLEGCGRCAVTPNSRFGCWVCTVVRRDRLLENLAPHMRGYRVMLEAKERIRRVSLTPKLRAFREDGGYKGLNSAGRHEVVSILADVLIDAREALEGYLEEPRLRRKLQSWFEETYAANGNPRLETALQLLGK